MSKRIRYRVWAAAVILGACSAWANVAGAGEISATYYALSSSDPSYNTMCCSWAGGEVLSSLGPDGLPLYNPAYTGPAVNAADLQATGAGREITWWSPALNSHVTRIGTGLVSLPINLPYNYYPCVVSAGYACNDAAAGLAAHYSGTLSVASSGPIQFSLGADDSAYAYLDGQLVCSESGVHPYAPETCASPTAIGAGTHSFDLFFVDLNQVQSGLTFSILTPGVTAEVPEPASASLLGLGMVGLLAARRRRAR